MRFRELQNGDLIAPHRGNPKPPAGYCRDSGNPYLFHPILLPCNYYVPYEEKLSCGRLDIGVFCDYYEKPVTGGECQKCQENAVVQKTGYKKQLKILAA